MKSQTSNIETLGIIKYTNNQWFIVCILLKTNPETLVIKDSSKEFKEEMKWNVPTYSINKNICSIMAHTHHVNFQIFQGSILKDSKLLYGTGKSMRHLRFENIEQMDITVLKKIIKQAINVDEGKNDG